MPKRVAVVVAALVIDSLQPGWAVAVSVAQAQLRNHDRFQLKAEVASGTVEIHGVFRT